MLTKKQKNLLLFINKKIRSTGVSPSYEEMKNSLNLKSKSGIHRLISALEERGFIKRLAHKARALEVVKLPENAKPTISDRDFVVATIAPPTIVKEPEKPAETEAVEGAEGEVPATEGSTDAAPVKDGDAAKKADAPKKDEKGKDQAGDKKAAKPPADKKQTEKK